jgi:tetratricopeptide (TPR) repeat protein
LRGRYFLHNRDAIESAEYFQRAISREPSYASAYAGLADALEAKRAVGLARPEEVMPAAVAAAKRAIELDPNNGEAYTALGTYETVYHWDWGQRNGTCCAESRLAQATRLQS